MTTEQDGRRELTSTTDQNNQVMISVQNTGNQDVTSSNVPSNTEMSLNVASNQNVTSSEDHGNQIVMSPNVPGDQSVMLATYSTDQDMMSSRLQDLGDQDVTSPPAPSNQDEISQHNDLIHMQRIATVVNQ